MQENDITDQLQQQVEQAVAAEKAITIVGGNSKHFLGFVPQDDSAGSNTDTDNVAGTDHVAGNSEALTLNTTAHCGIVNYEPTELVVTVRTGTSMQALNQVLQDNGQYLPFEPPVLNTGTIGGVLATGLSGPSRPFSGAVRDYVLGMRIINGKAECLRFGGEVMKNVAGYDAARLQVGAFGTMGVLLETSMKVLPLPEATETLVHELDTELNNAPLIKLMRQAVPLTAAAVVGNKQYIRLSGSQAAVDAAKKQLGGDVLSGEQGVQFWLSLRDLTHAFFNSDKTLWRVSVPEYADALTVNGDWLYDWAGAQRWLLSHEPAQTIFNAAEQAGGHATRFSAGGDALEIFQPINGGMRVLQQNLRSSFDPQGLFNPNRFHAEFNTPQV